MDKIRGVVDSLLAWHYNLFQNSLAFRIGELVVTGFVVFYAVFLLIKRHKNRNKSKINLKRYKSRDKTDLDILYDILRSHKELKISTISRTFKVKKDVAMEWGRILENGDIALIDYPNFGEPVIKLAGKENVQVELKPKELSDMKPEEVKNVKSEASGVKETVKKKKSMKVVKRRASSVKGSLKKKVVKRKSVKGVKKKINKVKKGSKKKIVKSKIRKVKKRK